ncbi:MAG: ribosome recycling factor [Candidatus Eisenbacteria bacterium]|nr:ribosome recycling factor [Candidatus Eisenbacteria bacterium]
MMEALFAETRERMEKAVDAVRREFAKIRTGKATVSLLDGVKVEAYGSTVPLRQVANISVPEARLLVVQPWDKKLLGDIEKAIQAADLGLNPSNDGNIIRVPIPPLTEERRKELVRHVHKLAEEGRVAVRNVRRDVNETLKEMQKNGDISEDEYHRAHDKTIQEMTDESTHEIDAALAAKEAELMEV